MRASPIRLTPNSSAAFAKEKVGFKNFGKGFKLVVGAGADIIRADNAAADFIKTRLSGHFGDDGRFAGTGNAHKHFDRTVQIQQRAESKHLGKAGGQQAVFVADTALKA